MVQVINGVQFGSVNSDDSVEVSGVVNGGI